MQTFLPYADFVSSAECLDSKRLGKQRVECLQLLNALLGYGGWRHHPAAVMWSRHPRALVLYGTTICDEWIRRGFVDTCRPKLVQTDTKLAELGPVTFPRWIGFELFHASHRSNLLRKNPVWYGQFGWTEPPDLEYIWPLP
jgi:hypothetical protein